MKIRDNKGSITVFVLVGLLFMTGFLIISFGSNVNKSKVAKEQFNIMSSIYSHNDGDANAYERAYTAIRKRNAQTLTASIENSAEIELTKTFEDKVSNYRIYGKGVEILPEEYQKVEWIGTDGNSWFVSNFNINNLDRFTIYYSYNANGTSTNYMWGASSYPASNGSRFLHRYSQIMLNDKSNTGVAFSIPISNNLESIVIVANNINKTIKCYNNATVYSTSSWNNKKDFDNFGILCNNYNRQPSSYKARSGSQIAEFRVVNDDTGEDVFNLIPCYRKSDNVIGMYDSVSKVFFTNEGTGTFTKGANVEVKSVGVGDKIENIFNADDIISKNSSTVSIVQFGGKSCLTWKQGNTTTNQRMLEGKFKANTIYNVSGYMASSQTNYGNLKVFYTDGSSDNIKFNNCTAGEFRKETFVIGNSNKTIAYIRGGYYNNQIIYLDINTFQIIEENSFIGDQYIEKQKTIVPVRISGKNLVNIPNMNIKVTSYYYYNYFPQNPVLLLQPSTKYTVSFDYVINSATTQVHCGIGYGTTMYSVDIVNDADYPNQTKGRFKYTFTTPATFSSSYRPNLQFRFVRTNVSGTVDLDISNVQVEFGEVATAYELYQESQEFTIILTSSLKEGEYIDFKTSKVVRADGTEESIELPELSTYEDYTKIEVLTEDVPSKIEVEYLGYTIE